MTCSGTFNIEETIDKLKKYLPNQPPLKDFINQNTLEAFQEESFYKAIHKATIFFGYKTSLLDDDYRALYLEGRINEKILDQIIKNKKGEDQVSYWRKKLLEIDYPNEIQPRIGQIRKLWKKYFDIDIDSYVHSILFRVLCNYLDQGIAIWDFPLIKNGFLNSVIEIEKNTHISIFKNSIVQQSFIENKFTIEELLAKLIGEDSTYYEQYLFDQQWAHQGWSGIVKMIEKTPHSLLDVRSVCLNEIILFELYLEWDTLLYHCGHNWKPLGPYILENNVEELFSDVSQDDFFQTVEIWQEAFEWTYFDQVIAGITKVKDVHQNNNPFLFQALFCIDDREGSLRRYIEHYEPSSETYATPGHFNVDCYFQPAMGKHITKLAPPPVTPKHLIKELSKKSSWSSDLEFSKNTNSLFRGWLLSFWLGFWSILKLFKYIFKPNMSTAVASSFKHMDENSQLTIEHDPSIANEFDYQLGFTVDEMTTRVETVLRSIGLIKGFAPIIYIVGHGSSSINNPLYAAYDCGACSGRPGSVNARIFSFMANHPVVRINLANKGIYIPGETQFVGALHDTTRDDILFFDDNILSSKNKQLHKRNKTVFEKALNSNAKERSRRFKSIDTTLSEQEIHKKVQERSVSLFQPRPELDHATNALCIVGNRYLTKGLFLDRRAFMNSYNYKFDLEGVYLRNILNAAIPVCGGINLQYYFSRVDNQKLGSGTKLPHNVMGLLGVANGTDGDLRPGLPIQAIEAHDPLRLLMIVEHYPTVVKEALLSNASTYSWVKNQWMHLIVLHPETRDFYILNNEEFIPYQIITNNIEEVQDIMKLIESKEDNFPVYVLKP